MTVFPMEVSLQIPDELAERIGGHVALLEKAALEAVAAKAYEEDLLSLEQVRALLELPSQWEAVAVLKRHQVWPGLSVDEVLDDMAVVAEKLAALQTYNLIAEKAARGSQENFLKAMSAVPAGVVREGDEIPSGYKRKSKPS